MLIPILTAITLLVGGALVLGGALVMTRRARVAMDERVSLVARANAAEGQRGAYTASLHAKAKKLDDADPALLRLRHRAVAGRCGPVR